MTRSLYRLTLLFFMKHRHALSCMIAMRAMILLMVIIMIMNFSSIKSQQVIKLGFNFLEGFTELQSR